MGEPDFCSPPSRRAGGLLTVSKFAGGFFVFVSVNSLSEAHTLALRARLTATPFPRNRPNLSAGHRISL